jgi:hypothetical protein
VGWRWRRKFCIELYVLKVVWTVSGMARWKICSSIGERTASLESSPALIKSTDAKIAQNRTSACVSSLPRVATNAQAGAVSQRLDLPAPSTTPSQSPNVQELQLIPAASSETAPPDPTRPPYRRHIACNRHLCPPHNVAEPEKRAHLRVGSRRLSDRQAGSASDISTRNSLSLTPSPTTSPRTSPPHAPPCPTTTPSKLHTTPQP